jgi:hypothetical protein
MKSQASGFASAIRLEVVPELDVPGVTRKLNISMVFEVLLAEILWISSLLTCGILKFPNFCTPTDIVLKSTMVPDPDCVLDLYTSAHSVTQKSNISTVFMKCGSYVVV